MPLSRTQISQLVARPARARVTSTKRSGFDRIAVLDGVGEQIDERELEPADIDDQRRHVVGDHAVDIAGIGHFAQLTRGLGRHLADRYVLQAGVVGSAVEPGQPLQLVGHFDEAGDVARDQLDGLRLLRRRRPGSRSSDTAVEIGASGWRHSCVAMRVNWRNRSACSVMVCVYRPTNVSTVSCSSTPTALCSRATTATHSAGRRRQHQPNRFVFDETQQDAAEQLVLAQHLVQRRALLMP